MFSWIYKILFADYPKDHRFYYLSLIKENEGFSIHGLWPQYDINKYPTFCNPVTFDLSNLTDILPELHKNWYSNRGPDESFWKHEYEKHGSCVFSKMTELEYFQKTLDLFNKAIELNLPEKYQNDKTNKCLIPVDLSFNFITKAI